MDSYLILTGWKSQAGIEILKDVHLDSMGRFLHTVW